MRMQLTTLYLSATEREALERLSAASGTKKSECMRAAIRDAAARLERAKAPARRARTV